MREVRVYHCNVVHLLMYTYTTGIILHAVHRTPTSTLPHKLNTLRCAAAQAVRERRVNSLACMPTTMHLHGLENSARMMACQYAYDTIHKGASVCTAYRKLQVGVFKLLSVVLHVRESQLPARTGKRGQTRERASKH